MAQYKTVPVAAGSRVLDIEIELTTEVEGSKGWRVDRIVRSDDGKSADIHFIKD